MIVIEPGVEGFGLYGPYIDLAPGRYLARIEFRWDRPLEGDATIDVCCEQVALILGVRHITSSTIVAEGMTAEVPFAVASPAREVEIRLACSAGRCVWSGAESLPPGDCGNRAEAAVLASAHCGPFG